MFVDTTRVPVSDEAGNTIYIKPKMDYGTRQRVAGAAIGRDGTTNMGGALVAMLTYNIVGWEGPAFAGVPCTPENIERLDPDEPLVEKVSDEIARRNPQKASPDPKSLAIAGSGTPGSDGSAARASKRSASTSST